MRTHDYSKFATAYARLGIQDTFYLGFRDLPQLIQKYVRGKKALDFGCGSGRSTRFLRELGFETIGVDQAKEQIKEARKLDPQGIYEVVNDHLPFQKDSFNLVLLFAVLMEVSSKEKMKKIFQELYRVLKKSGTIVMVTDAEGMYKHDCASFKYNFPENRKIKSGNRVKLAFRGTNIIFFDYYWTEQDYQEVFQETGFRVRELHKPLATGEEPFSWYSETKYPHFAVYVLRK